jgi:hypothetical protein
MEAKHSPVTTANSSQTKWHHMSEKSIFSQKLQEEVHKFSLAEDHYAQLIMGLHFDKCSEFYHLRIYVSQNHKYL